MSQLGVGGLCGFIGKELLCRMLCIMLSSCWFRLLELSMLYRYLAVAYLYCTGWLDVKGMMMSVNVGFLNMVAFRLVGVLFIDMSR